MSRSVRTLPLALTLLLLPLPLSGLDYQGGANKFAGGFSPSNAPHGGFGGGY